MKFATIHKPVSIALYVLSLGMPGYYVGSPQGFFEYLGIYNLVLGWLGLLFGQVAWFANPLFLLSFRKISQKSSAKLAIWSLAVALTFLVNPRMVRNTAQMGEIIHGFGLGYALWVSAIAIVLRTRPRRFGDPRRRSLASARGATSRQRCASPAP